MAWLQWSKMQGWGQARTKVKQMKGGRNLRGTYSGAGQVASIVSHWFPPWLGFSKFTKELWEDLLWEQSGIPAMKVHFFPLPLDFQLTQAPRLC